MHLKLTKMANKLEKFNSVQSLRHYINDAYLTKMPKEAKRLTNLVNSGKIAIKDKFGTMLLVDELNLLQ